jgi:hypothetical protein
LSLTNFHYYWLPNRSELCNWKKWMTADNHWLMTNLNYVSVGNRCFLFLLLHVHAQMNPHFHSFSASIKHVGTGSYNYCWYINSPVSRCCRSICCYRIRLLSESSVSPFVVAVAVVSDKWVRNEFSIHKMRGNEPFPFRIFFSGKNLLLAMDKVKDHLRPIWAKSIMS